MEHIKLFMGPSVDDVQEKLDKWTGSQDKKIFVIQMVGPFTVSSVSDGARITHHYSVSVIYDDDLPCDCGEQDASFKPEPHKKK